MSVMNQSGEEQVECPLCMEPLEVDDLNFYPCTCGYQICRFCWHRIRTDENGLCPACRKAYSENPADFTPLSQEQVQQLKAEKRQRDQQRKAKLSESRKHLASVRVVQKNLVFVVGLPVRLADPDLLKRHEYFGKFGKIHKVVINQSTSYAGSQGPSASAYVTYCKSDDALRAIQNVNNITLDGRLIKSSLGTTKYCSHFMKNQPCPKPDCMYLHELGDPEASFTKEQMHLGKHQEYEKKLHDGLLSRMSVREGGNSGGGVNAPQGGTGGPTNQPDNNHKKEQHTKSQPTPTPQQPRETSWPTLSGSSASSASSTDSGFGSKSEKSSKSESKSEKNQTKREKGNQKTKNSNNNTNSQNNNNNNNNNLDKKSDKNQVINQKQCDQNICQQNITENTKITNNSTERNNSHTIKNNLISQENIENSTSECIENLSKMQLLDDNSSFFSHNTFQKIVQDQDSSSYSDSSSVTPHSNILNDNLPDISSSEDWEAAFGFSKKSESPLEQNDLPTSNRNSIVSENVLNSFGNQTETNYKIEQQFNHLDFQKQQNFTEKTSRDILEALNRQNDIHLNSSAQFIPLPNQTLSQTKLQENLNGLDQQMSKFFAEFNKNKDLSSNNGYNGMINNQTNGFITNNERNSQFTNQLSETEHNLILLNQYQQRLLERQLEEQSMFNLKQTLMMNQQQPQRHQFLHQQGGHQGQFTGMNGSNDNFITSQNNGVAQFHNNCSGFQPNSVFQSQSMQRQTLRSDRPSVDDDLGFDPFIETQKALAELIESEQTVSQIQNSGLLNQNNLSSHQSNGAPPNGLIGHNGSSVQNVGNLPPPPPGFLQHNTTHMNSFGSKILPFLNMSNSPQINSTPNGWTSNNYNEAQLKGLAPVNDWTTLDPAIVSSSRHFPLVNLPQQTLREFNPFSQQINPNQQNQLRAFEFQNNSTYTNNYTNSNQHNMAVPQNYTNNGYTHLTTQHNGINNWYNAEIQNQISSPPGFRQQNVAQSKPQEC